MEHKESELRSTMESCDELFNRTISQYLHLLQTKRFEKRFNASLLKNSTVLLFESKYLAKLDEDTLYF